MADLLGVTRYQIPYPGLLWPMFSLFDSSPRYESTRVVDDFAKDKRSFWSHYATQLNANRRNCSPAGSLRGLNRNPLSVFRTPFVIPRPFISTISLGDSVLIDGNPDKALILWTNHTRILSLDMIARLAGIREAARCPPSLMSEGRTGCHLNSSG